MGPEPRPDPDRRMHSATSWVPQFHDGPKAWANVFMADDRAVRMKRYRTGPDILLGEIMRFAVRRDAVSAAEVSDVYDVFLRGGMPVEVRREILLHARGFQDEANLPIEVYLPFIDKDPDFGVCAGAVIDWVSSAELTHGDPMSRIKEMIEMIVRHRAENVGAVFGGLLHLGDPRVCALLAPLRDRLTNFETNEAVRCFTGLVSAAAAEFHLDWLEGLNGDGQDRRFGIVASGLALLRRNMQWPVAMTGERPFPWKSVTPEEQRRMARHIPIGVYTERIAPRLRALERREPEPKVMPQVLEVWGVAPSEK